MGIAKTGILFDLLKTKEHAKLASKSLNQCFLNFKIPVIESLKSVNSIEYPQFFNDEKESDLKFEIEGKFIYGVRSLISEKSIYFKNMLESGMRESRENIIMLTDIEYEIFLKVLTFLYVDQINLDSIEDGVKTLIAADRFQLLKLQSHCEAFLSKSVNSSNIKMLYSISFQYNSPLLRDACIHWFVNYLPELSTPMLSSFIQLPDFLEQLKTFFRVYSHTSFKKDRWDVPGVKFQTNWDKYSNAEMSTMFAINDDGDEV
eukprot:TRINITY_DN2235_c0_g2_i1.p1 TRINITY_DN2235_c0_g2~~TRINITY_DN2235_c0_g2_i1.p1  ORF type:complete len:260 (+),score=34.66 TRINITY_DN2235_c0_g2_i1:280-1059(+)